MGKLKKLRAEVRAAKEELQRLNTLLNDYKYGNGEEFEDNLAIGSAIGDLTYVIDGLKGEIADIKAKKSTAKSKKGGSRQKKTRRNRQ
jgi:hypothetical protein